MDIKLDENFEVEVNSENDLETVSGFELFRQRLITRLSLFQRNAIGSLNSPNAIRKVRREVVRALDDNPEIRSVETIDVSKTDHNEIEVYIVFNTDHTISEII